MNSLTPRITIQMGAINPTTQTISVIQLKSTNQAQWFVSNMQHILRLCLCDALPVGLTVLFIRNALHIHILSYRYATNRPWITWAQMHKMNNNAVCLPSFIIISSTFYQLSMQHPTLLLFKLIYYSIFSLIFFPYLCHTKPIPID